MKNFISIVNVERLTDRLQQDCDKIRHAIEPDKYCFGTHNDALCGSKPEKQSVGFVNDPKVTKVTCKCCLKKIRKGD